MMNGDTKEYGGSVLAQWGCLPKFRLQFRFREIWIHRITIISFLEYRKGRKTHEHMVAAFNFKTTFYV